MWEAATKHMPTQKDMRTIWSILAIFSGVFLALSLSITALEVLAKSPHVLDWAAWTVTFSIWLSVALYARRPEYYEALRRGSRWVASIASPEPSGSGPSAFSQGLPRACSVSALAPRFSWAWCCGLANRGEHTLFKRLRFSEWKRGS